VSLLLALYVNLTRNKENDHDIETVLLFHFKHYYSYGNVLFTLTIIFGNTLRILNVILCLFTFYMYSYAYYNHKTKLSNVQFKNILSFISTSVNISFLLAWNLAYLTISISNFLNAINLSLISICYVGCFLQALLSISCVLAISHFKDYFFCFIIIIFQLGNLVNNKILSYEEYEVIRHYNFFNFIFTALTIICFVWSIYFREKKEDVHVVNNNYKGEYDII
jgi:hypothetical protein